MYYVLIVFGDKPAVKTFVPIDQNFGIAHACSLSYKVRRGRVFLCAARVHGSDPKSSTAI